MVTRKFGEVCRHSSLRRCCDICDLEEDVEGLLAERRMLRLELDGQRATVRVHEFTIRQLSTRRDELTAEVAQVKAALEASREARELAINAERLAVNAEIVARQRRK